MSKPQPADSIEGDESRPRTAVAPTRAPAALVHARLGVEGGKHREDVRGPRAAVNDHLFHHALEHNVCMSACTKEARDYMFALPGSRAGPRAFFVGCTLPCQARERCPHNAAPNVLHCLWRERSVCAKLRISGSGRVLPGRGGLAEPRSRR